MKNTVKVFILAVLLSSLAMAHQRIPYEIYGVESISTWNVTWYGPLTNGSYLNYGKNYTWVMNITGGNITGVSIGGFTAGNATDGTGCDDTSYTTSGLAATTSGAAKTFCVTRRPEELNGGVYNNCTYPTVQISVTLTNSTSTATNTTMTPAIINTTLPCVEVGDSDFTVTGVTKDTLTIDSASGLYNTLSFYPNTTVFEAACLYRDNITGKGIVHLKDSSKGSLELWVPLVTNASTGCYAPYDMVQNDADTVTVQQVHYLNETKPSSILPAEVKTAGGVVVFGLGLASAGAALILYRKYSNKPQ